MSAFIRTVRDDASVELARLDLEINEVEAKLLNLKRERAVVHAMVASAQKLQPIIAELSVERTRGWWLRRSWAS